VLLTQAETAELLRLSERTLERWRVTGGGPVFCKLGKRVLYRKADLEKWIASHLCNSTSDEASYRTS
jgi:excisionase family DNA binding protein